MNVCKILLKRQPPAKPWLEPASEYAADLMQDIYNQEMDKL